MSDQMTGNIQELSVSELSNALKRTVEDAYSYVRVRGEISGFKRAASGHLYMALKDQDAVLDAVCWRGSASKLMARPEDGLEVIATGRLTTYPGRSKYQIVIEQIELAGEGALLKLLEERKRRLAEEGLFDPDRKKPIPFLPQVIGVVTSPTGAVIRDILHRLADRFPRHVLLWPVLVQGEGAAAQVAAAIDGFNRLTPDGPIPRPDVLIVARGGGSLEDLWGFNEEIVVRAAAASTIPLISAVGHETDTTLIDFASDRRAPTPTAAAEMAVPVRADLLADLVGFEQRLISAGARGLENRSRYLEGLARGLPQPRRLMEPAMQRLDDLSERLSQAPARILREKADRLDARAGRLRSPSDQIRRASDGLSDLTGRLDRAARYGVDREQRRFTDLRVGDRSLTAMVRRLKQDGERLARFGQAVEALSYRGTLKRGYAVVRDTDGALVTQADGISAGMALEIEFAEDKRISVLAGEAGTGRKSSPRKKPAADPKTPPKQQDLF
ncbi:exodeoxyribonuclease VII large subunit [Rhodospirillaceae bacterium KN72]|uniref:Exodeoxyribonuclease 7 large subunit n=2 Tax=Pacificispira spongiicola TaxID=2729598 RepID=A0A7Y0HG85_9PROT|nr:exodeoxyribonuclease VII large subunit [Pacificispira spongiicola]